VLSPANVQAFLVERGLASGDDPVRAHELGGGVSNVVLEVLVGGEVVVVKQARPRLQVVDDWHATPERALREAAALDMVRAVTPHAVPRVLDVDPSRHVVVLERAPSAWRDWKSLLLDGVVDADVARRLGALTAAWHGYTADHRDALGALEDWTPFDQLRVDPYYRTAAQRRPEIAGALADYAAAMQQRRRCLVHGDLSPKNVLLGDGGLWVIDFEVAHVGDPTFDLAFLLCHLALKTVHHPADASALGRAAAAFWSAYHAEAPTALHAEASYVFGHVGCLLAARVDGKSPAEYLTEPSRARVRMLAASFLADPPDGVEPAWSRLAG
jgi:aminoglycoside phosphotransferase (APT) family kinase protein